MKMRPNQALRIEGDFQHRGLWIALVLALAIRMIVLIGMQQPLVSDARAYFHMASAVAQGRAMTDIFGQYAFYSPGYPLLLAGAFSVFGGTLVVAQIVNLCCALATITMTYHLARAMSGHRAAPVLTAVLMAIWLPHTLAVGSLAKENFSTPLLVGYMLLLVSMVRGGRPLLTAAAAGIVYGCSLLVGGAVIATIAGFCVALWLRPAPLRQKTLALVCHLIAILAIVAPWLLHVHAALGVTTLSTNAPFNLYLGNNPAATGWYESILKTPLGPVWHARSAQLGEAGTAAWLNHEAMSYIVGHPVATLEMTLKKLLYFWFPHSPRSSADHSGTMLVLMRMLADIQYLLVLGFGVIGAIRGPLQPNIRALLMAVIVGFWLVHGAICIIPRYHDPVMPLMICCAAVWIAHGFAGKQTA
jgi:hypothetical protein